MIVDAPEITFALAHGSGRDFGILDIGGFQVSWLVSVGSVSLQEVSE
jgi:hypothetical protein